MSMVRERLGTGAYACFRRRGTIRPNGKFRRAHGPLPAAYELKHADLIVGGGLARYVLLQPMPVRRGRHMLDTLRITPLAASMARNCDGCANRHRNSNLQCSASVGSATRRFAPGVAFALRTGNEVGRLRELAVTESSAAASRVHRVSVELRL
jgi:hypothetical protein